MYVFTYIAGTFLVGEYTLSQTQTFRSGGCWSWFETAVAASVRDSEECHFYEYHYVCTLVLIATSLRIMKLMMI